MKGSIQFSELRRSKTTRLFVHPTDRSQRNALASFEWNRESNSSRSTIQSASLRTFRRIARNRRVCARFVHL